MSRAFAASDGANETMSSASVSISTTEATEATETTETTEKILIFWLSALADHGNLRPCEAVAIRLVTEDLSRSPARRGCGWLFR